MSVTIERRFRGPATSGNGGYTSGLLAEALVAAGKAPAGTPAVRVRLSTPPPLDRPLDVTVDAPGGGATLRDGETVVATASWAALEAAEPVAPVDRDAAAATAEHYVDLETHPFPGCFVCGPGRAEGDGLRLFAGQLAPGRTACVWRPESRLADATSAEVPLRFVWAALDCPGGWTSDLVGRPMVLGTMTTQVLRMPRTGEDHVVVGRLDRSDDRRTWTSTALWAGDGELVARAEAIWIKIDPAVFDQIFAEHP